MSQPKIVRIRFEINAAAGEIPFRTFRSTTPINGKMFVVLSKLTANNEVEYQIIGADAQGPVQLGQGVVSMDTFFERVRSFETVLKSKNPNVDLVQDNDQNVMLTNAEGFRDNKITKEQAARMLQEIEENNVANIFKSAPSSNRLKKYF